MSNYPRLGQPDVREFVTRVVQHHLDAGKVKQFLAGKGADDVLVPLPELESLVEEIIAACGTQNDMALEPVEAKFCGRVHQVLDGLPDEALGDSEFWSYLAVRYFWRFIARRQHAAWVKVLGEDVDEESAESEGVKLERYLVGKDHYQIPLRMYLRGQAIRDAADYVLSEIEGGSTDFWRSQVLGVRTSAYPPLARALVNVQSEARLNVEEQRPSGRRLNRLRANIDFTLHSQDEALPIVRDLWGVTDDDRTEIAAKRRARVTAPRATAKTKVATTKKAARLAQPSDDVASTSTPHDSQGDAPTATSQASLGRYLGLTSDLARKQWISIKERQPYESGRRQPAFLPVETILCAAAMRGIDYRSIPKADRDTPPKPLNALATLFRRPGRSVLAKLANLDGSPKNGVAHERELFEIVQAEPATLDALYRLVVDAARAERITARALPDFLTSN